MKLGDDLTERSPSGFRGLQKDRPTSRLLLRKAETWICDLKGFRQLHFKAFDQLYQLLKISTKYQTKPKLNQAFNYIFWTNHHGIYAKFPCSTCFQAKPRCYRRWLVRLGRLREPRKRDRVWRWLCPFGTQPFPIGSRRAPMGRWSTDPWMDG